MNYQLDDRPGDRNIIDKRHANFPECQRTGRFRRSRGLVVARRVLRGELSVLEDIQGPCVPCTKHNSRPAWGIKGEQGVNNMSFSESIERERDSVLFDVSSFDH